METKETVEVEAPNHKGLPPIYLVDTDKYQDIKAVLIENNIKPLYTKQGKQGICFQLDKIEEK